MPMEGASLPMNAQSAILPVRCSGKFGRIRARTRSARRYLYKGATFSRMRYISGSGARALRLDRVARSLVLMVFNGVA